MNIFICFQGGVIARALLNFSQNRNIVKLIITLASPHKMPVVNLDYNFDRFYRQIDSQWSMKNINTTGIAPSSKTWRDKVFITIGGGARDILVPSALISSPHSDINALVRKFLLISTFIIFNVGYMAYAIFGDAVIWRFFSRRGRSEPESCKNEDVQKLANHYKARQLSTRTCRKNNPLSCGKCPPVYAQCHRDQWR